MSNDFYKKLSSIPQYSFLCNACKENFNIHFRYIKSKQAIECPCCGQKLDNNIFENLKQAVEKLEQASMGLSKAMSMRHPLCEEGFYFSIMWDEKNPSEYSKGDF